MVDLEGLRLSQQIYNAGVQYALEVGYIEEFGVSLMICRKEIWIFDHKSLEKVKYELHG